MPSPRPFRGRTAHVTIVSDNPETLDGLEAYLRRAGLTTYGTRRLERSHDVTPRSACAVVIFPDDFGVEAVRHALAALRAERPRVLPVLVTREPRRFETRPRGEGLSPLVVPKPVWGWTILEAIRDRLDADRV